MVTKLKNLKDLVYALIYSREQVRKGSFQYTLLLTPFWFNWVAINLMNSSLHVYVSLIMIICLKGETFKKVTQSMQKEGYFFIQSQVNDNETSQHKTYVRPNYILN